MAVFRIFLLMLIAFLSIPFSANAQYECAGSLTQEHFLQEIKALNVALQRNINNYRGLQAELAVAPEESEKAARIKKQLSELNSELQKQKKAFKEINSPKFPETKFTVYGAACVKRRWVKRAKKVLLERPEYFGKHFHVWMDKKTGTVMVFDKRPKSADVLP